MEGKIADRIEHFIFRYIGIVPLMLLLLFGEIPILFKAIIIPGIAVLYIFNRKRSIIARFFLIGVVILNVYIGRNAGYFIIYSASVTHSRANGWVYSQILYTYGGNADLIIPLFVENKTVYISEDSVYYNYFRNYAKEIVSAGYGQEADYDELKSMMVRYGPLDMSAYSYLVEDTGNSPDEIPQLYISENFSGDEVFVLVDSNMNIFMADKNEKINK